jgi:glutathionylspermidine synthase
VVQWHWLQERFPAADQFNSLWEGLVETWTALRSGGR